MAQIYTLDYSITSNYYIFGGGLTSGSNTVPFIGLYNNGGLGGYYFLEWIVYYLNFGDGYNFFITSLSFADDGTNMYALMRSKISNNLILSYILNNGGTVSKSVVISVNSE